MAYPTHIDPIEPQIIDAILIAALANGYVVSVCDGEEWSLRRSNDIEAIRAAVAASDETTLMFRDPANLRPDGNPARVGSVYLVHGNGCEVICACSDNKAINNLLAPATEIADRLEAV